MGDHITGQDEEDYDGSLAIRGRVGMPERMSSPEEIEAIPRMFPKMLKENHQGRGEADQIQVQGGSLLHRFVSGELYLTVYQDMNGVIEQFDFGA